MDKKAFMAAIIVLVLSTSFFTVTGYASAQQGVAYGRDYPLATPIYIRSPSNTTYDSSNLMLDVTVKACNSPSTTSVNYSIDDGERITVPLISVFEPIYATRTYANGTTDTVISLFSQYNYTGIVPLVNLSKGSHHLTVYSQYVGDNVIGLGSQTVYFAVNSTNSQASEPSSSQDFTRPTAPEFTVELTSPPESQSVNGTIELSIKNQPSVSFYNVRMRVNDGAWSLLYPNNSSVPSQSNGEYTVLSYRSGHLGVEFQYHLGYTSWNLSAGDKVDFQVQAMIGIIQRVFNPNFTDQLDMYPYTFTGETSDWSKTQTIIITESSFTNSPTPTLTATPSPPPTQPQSLTESPSPTTSIPELSMQPLLIAALALTAVIAAAVTFWKKRQEVNV